jgi:hypothetical protein
MIVTERLNALTPETNWTVLIRTVESDVCSGKYLVGAHLITPKVTAVILDDRAEYHSHIASKYKVRALGGGRFRMDMIGKRVELYARSEAYGQEPSRSAVQIALQHALPGYAVVIQD